MSGNPEHRSFKAASFVTDCLGSPRFTIFVTKRLTLFRITSRPMLSRRVRSLKCICPKIFISHRAFASERIIETRQTQLPDAPSGAPARARLGAPKVQNLAPPRGRSYLQLSIFHVL